MVIENYKDLGVALSKTGAMKRILTFVRSVKHLKLDYMSYREGSTKTTSIWQYRFRKANSIALTRE
jgi:hypothetical protein